MPPCHGRPRSALPPQACLAQADGAAIAIGWRSREALPTSDDRSIAALGASGSGGIAFRLFAARFHRPGSLVAR